MARIIGMGGNRWKHLSGDDRAVWALFQTKVNLDGWSQEYDVELGHESMTDIEVDPVNAKLWHSLRQKRADVVLKRGTEVRLIELKRRATSSALGQLLSYRHLYNNNPANPYPCSGWLICLMVDDDLVPLFDGYGFGTVEMLNPARPLNVQREWGRVVSTTNLPEPR